MARILQQGENAALARLARKPARGYMEPMPEQTTNALNFLEWNKNLKERARIVSKVVDDWFGGLRDYAVQIAEGKQPSKTDTVMAGLETAGLVPAAKIGGAVGAIFTNRNSFGIPLHRLASHHAAEGMHNLKQTPEDIFERTGNIIDPYGQSFGFDSFDYTTLDFNQIPLVPSGGNKTAELGDLIGLPLNEFADFKGKIPKDVLENTKLIRYPEGSSAEGFNARNMLNTRGVIGIEDSNADRMRSVFAHENTHNLMSAAKAEPGSSPDIAIDDFQDTYFKTLDKVKEIESLGAMQKVRNKFKKNLPYNTDIYRANLGEVLARQSENMVGISPEEQTSLINHLGLYGLDEVSNSPWNFMWKKGHALSDEQIRRILSE